MVLSCYGSRAELLYYERDLVCIVDDNRELRNALEEIITMSEGYRCTGTIGTAEDAVSQIPLLRPDVVLMDINLGSAESGIDVVKDIETPYPRYQFHDVYRV